MKIGGIGKFIRGLFSRSGRGASKLQKLKKLFTSSKWYKKLVKLKPIQTMRKGYFMIRKAVKKKLGRVVKFIKKHKLAFAGIGGGLVGGAIAAAFASIGRRDEEQSTVVYDENGDYAPGETDEVINRRLVARHNKAAQYARSYLRVLGRIIDDYETKTDGDRYFSPDYNQSLVSEAAELLGKACLLDDTDFLVSMNARLNTCARIVQCGLNIDDQQRSAIGEVSDSEVEFTDLDQAMHDVNFYLEHSQMFY